MGVGLFSMERTYFFESGSYDGEMNYYGGENIEMPFRVCILIKLNILEMAYILNILFHFSIALGKESFFINHFHRKWRV